MAVAISPDVKLLALSGPGGSVHVWDVLTGKELTVLHGHTMAVNALSFSMNALILVGTGLLLGAAGSGLTIRRFLQV